MAEEYITRKAARDVLSALAIRHFELTDLFKIYIKALEDVDAELLKIPSADVKPIRHGHWVKSDELFECSECGISYEQEEHYCPWCGTRMGQDGDTNESSG